MQGWFLKREKTQIYQNSPKHKFRIKIDLFGCFFIQTYNKLDYCLIGCHFYIRIKFFRATIPFLDFKPSRKNWFLKTRFGKITVVSSDCWTARCALASPIPSCQAFC